MVKRQKQGYHNVFLITLASVIGILLFLALYINLQYSKPLLLDFSNQNRDEKNHLAANQFLDKGNDRIKVIGATGEKFFELQRESSGIEVAEYNQQNDLIRELTCSGFSSSDNDYGGRMILLEKCGESGSETILLGTLPY